MYISLIRRTALSSGQNGVIIKTTNGGSNWNVQNSGVNSELAGIMFADNSDVYAVGFSGTILKSADGGGSWSPQTGITAEDLRSVYFVDTNTGYVAGYTGTILKTTNGGANWEQQVSNTANNLFSVYFANATTGTAAGTGSILRTTNGGINWTLQSVAFSGDLYGLAFVNASTGWAAGQTGKIFYTDNGGVGVRVISTEVPERFALQQNYPNPFNPVTKIRFDLPAERIANPFYNIRLTVYDILGNEIATLINENQPAGSYEVTFDSRLSGKSGDLSSGIYFYKLSAGDYIETKSMVLMK